MTHSTKTESTAEKRRLSRRSFVATGTLAVAALAGCLGSDDGGPNGTGNETDANGETDPLEDIPAVTDPPAAVYKPTHRASVLMEDVVEVGDYSLLPHLTYPHQFWRVDGEDTVEVFPTVDDGAHLMLAVWDTETGKLLPVDSGATLEIRFDGDPVETVTPWPMISQTMGFHFGDNVALPEVGSYTLVVTMNPIDTRKTGTFEGRFETTRTATVEFEWTDDRRQELLDGVEFLEESEWGEPGALEPMGQGGSMHGDEGMMGDGGMMGDDGGMMGHGPPPGLQPASEYPGTDLGTHSSGDASFVVRYLEGSRLADGDDYLLVSPRTPYNRIPLPDMALSMTRDGTSTALTQTLDGELGLHYGAAVSLEPGEGFDIVVDSPPQVARHRGYETAFFDMSPMRVEIPS